MLKYASHFVLAIAFVASPIAITDFASDRRQFAARGSASAQEPNVDLASLQRDLVKLRSMQEAANRRAAEIAAKHHAEKQAILKASIEIERKAKELAEGLAEVQSDQRAEQLAIAEAAIKTERDRILRAWAELRRKIAEEKQKSEQAAVERKAQVERLLAALHGAKEKIAPATGQGKAKTFNFAPSSQAPARPAAEVERIKDNLSRARKLIENGLVNEGRLFLEHVADAGSAEGAFELAETYDPVVLRNNGAVGVVPDKSLAIKWYRRAGELGANDTEIRIKRLSAR